jgi:hypothetical protein
MEENGKRFVYLLVTNTMTKNLLRVFFYSVLKPPLLFDKDSNLTRKDAATFRMRTVFKIEIFIGFFK